MYNEKDEPSNNTASSLLSKDIGGDHKLHNFIFVMLFAFTLWTVGSIIFYERSKQLESAKNNLGIATWLIQQHLKFTSHDKDWNIAFDSDSKHLIDIMNQIRLKLGCRIYIVDSNATLILKDNLPGPFGSENGQHFNLIPSLEHVIKEATDSLEPAHYRSLEGNHLVLSTSLYPNARLITDTLLPSYLSALSPTSLLALIIGSSLAFLTRNMIHKKQRHWRKQSLAQSIIDPLTSLPNRRGFEVLAKQLRTSKEALGIDCYLFLVNINGLRNINAQYGIEAGDMVIRQTSTSLRRYFPKESVICQWSGGEFLALVYDDKSNLIHTLSTSIAQTISAQEFILSGEKAPVSIKSTALKMLPTSTLSDVIVKAQANLRANR